MRLFLVGPHEGKSKRIAGFLFRDGMTELPDDAGPAKNILMNFHSAYPEEMLKRDEETGKLVLREAITYGQSAADITLDIPRTEPVSYELEGLNADGGMTKDAPDAPPAGRQRKPPQD